MLINKNPLLSYKAVKKSLLGHLTDLRSVALAQSVDGSRFKSKCTYLDITVSGSLKFLFKTKEEINIIFFKKKKKQQHEIRNPWLILSCTYN